MITFVAYKIEKNNHFGQYNVMSIYTSVKTIKKKEKKYKDSAVCLHVAKIPDYHQHTSKHWLQFILERSRMETAHVNSH